MINYTQFEPPKLYAAKDENGVLAMYIDKPTRDNKNKCWTSVENSHGRWMYLDSSKYFTELTWDDEPIEVTILPVPTEESIATNPIYHAIFNIGAKYANELRDTWNDWI